MATKKIAAPNWVQRLIADTIGLAGRTVAVRLEDEKSIVFLDLKSRSEYSVRKADGSVMETQPQKMVDTGVRV